MAIRDSSERGWVTNGNALEWAGRGLVAAAMLASGGFFAWWGGSILRTMGDPTADNADGLYLLLGLPLVATAVGSFALAWAAARGHFGEFAWRAMIAVAVFACFAMTPYLLPVLT